MKLDRFDIVFDNENGVYNSGESVTGKLVIQFKYPMEVQGVYVDLIGMAKCEWSKLEDEDSKTYISEERYLGKRVLYFGSANEGDSLVYHPGGFTEYPFSVFIPTSAPSSFFGSRGEVTYLCSAKIDRGWKGIQQKRKEFTVIHHLNLSQRANLSNPVYAEEEENVESCCTGSGMLYVKLDLEKKGFVPGEVMSFDVNIVNRSTQRISGISLNLHQSVTYTGTLIRGIGNTKQHTKHDVIPVCEYLDHIPKQGQVTLRMTATIPPVPPSKLEGCSFIDINYDLVLHVMVGWTHVTIETEVFIGTIPMIDSQSDEGEIFPQLGPLSLTSIPAHIASSNLDTPLPSGSPPPQYVTIEEAPPAYEDIVSTSLAEVKLIS